MKKIYYNGISLDYNSYGDSYEVDSESFECEYSEEWTQNEEDPIKDYVKNSFENFSDCSFEDAGYSWDDYGGISLAGELYFDGPWHVLCRNGIPVEFYYIKEEEEEEND